MITIHNFNADTYGDFRKKFLSPFITDAGGQESINAKTPDYERETFVEYVSSVFSDDIKLFVKAAHETSEYRNFIFSIFENALNVKSDDPVFKLLDFLDKEGDFFSCPASTKYHGNELYGLVRHSLMVLANGLKLAPIMLNGDVDMYFLAISCLFHDLCKVNMYEMKTRNVKNEETGNWEKAPYYKVKDFYMSYGHGIESMIRLNEYIKMPEAWNQAIRWHMGAYDISPLDKIAMEKALFAYREVLFLHTADMLAGIVDNV